MGKASSSKKVARAARAAGKPGGGRNLGWPALIGSVVVVGVVLIVFSRGKAGDLVAPILGDHWHAAYAIYDCDHFIAPLSDTVQDTSGLHTHDDSLMHLHPFGTRYTGDGANIGNWGLTTGLELSDSKVSASGIARENGDKCGDEEGKLQLKVWDSPTDETGHLITEDFADYAPQEFTLWTLAFVPEGTDIPKPPPEAIAALQAPSDVQPGASTPSVSVVPDDGTTTVPGDTSSTTTATADTTPSSEPSTTVTTTAP